MDSFPRKGPWAGRVALLPALRRVAGMGWMLRLPPQFWELGRAGMMGLGQRKIPWDSSRATAEPQGTAKEEDCPRSFVGVVSTQKMLPKGAQARSPHLTGTAGRGKSHFWQNGGCNLTTALLLPQRMSNPSTLH